MIDSLYDEARKEGLVVAWLYVDYLAQEEQTVTNMMGAILKRVVGRREIPKEIEEAFPVFPTGQVGQAAAKPGLA